MPATRKKKLLFSLAVLALFLAGAELILRLINPEFIRLAKAWYTIERYAVWNDHDLRPDARANFQLHDPTGYQVFDFDAQNNAIALRCSALADSTPATADLPASSSESHVVHCLGDSFTFGWGLPYEESFPFVLGQGLGPGYAVLNLGVPSFGLIAAAEKSRLIAGDNRPDTIIYLFHESDLLDDVKTSQLAERSWLVHQLNRLKYFVARHSYLGSSPWGLALWASYTHQVWPFQLPSGGPRLRDPNLYEMVDESMRRKLSRHPRSPEPPQNPTCDALRKLAERCRQDGTRLVVALMGSGESEAMIYYEAQRLGIPTVHFVAYAELVIPRENHLNRDGNRLLAQFLHRQVFTKTDHRAAVPEPETSVSPGSEPLHSR